MFAPSHSLVSIEIPSRLKNSKEKTESKNEKKCEQGGRGKTDPPITLRNLTPVGPSTFFSGKKKEKKTLTRAAGKTTEGRGRALRKDGEKKKKTSEPFHVFFPTNRAGEL